MASATFGRKGLPSDGGAQRAPRRRQFGTASTPASEPTAVVDPVADRRAAFLASERARAADATDEEAEQPPSGEKRTAIFIKERSLATAYILWFFLGGFSAHRFYLGTPLTAIAQVCLWYISLMFFMAGHGAAFYTLALGWLWIIADLFLIPQLRNAANERARQRTEALVFEKAEPEGERPSS